MKHVDPKEFMERNASVSDCGTWRYILVRRWDKTPRLLPFVMLNPSTADHKIDDPTIRRCVAFARSMGYGGIIVVNLFAYRATKPEELKANWGRAIGPNNQRHTLDVAAYAVKYDVPIVCAWGVHGRASNQDIMTVHLLTSRGAKLKCFGRTKDGSPRHPLYVKGDTPLEDFS